jgi:CDP-diglyceride synthetase
MTNKNNIGEAILLLGLLFLNIWHPDVILLIVSIGLAILPIWTWHSVTTDKKGKQLLEDKLSAEIRLLNAKTAYYQSDSGNETK